MGAPAARAACRGPLHIERDLSTEVRCGAAGPSFGRPGTPGCLCLAVLRRFRAIRPLAGVSIMHCPQASQLGSRLSRGQAGVDCRGRGMEGAAPSSVIQTHHGHIAKGPPPQAPAYCLGPADGSAVISGHRKAKRGSGVWGSCVVAWSLAGMSMAGTPFHLEENGPRPGLCGMRRRPGSRPRGERAEEERARGSSSPCVRACTRPP